MPSNYDAFSLKLKLRLFFHSTVTIFINFVFQRITGWVRLEGTTVGHLVPPPDSSRGILEYMAQDSVQMILEYIA